jgi:hypothetical protein
MFKKLLGIEEAKDSIRHNYTVEFIRFLEVNNNTPDFSFILLTMGAGGSGKTAIAFMMSHILLKVDPKRHVLLYRVPESLVPSIHESLKANSLEEWCPRFRRIENLREVDVNAILIIDEGVLNANAKEALMKEMVDFEQDLSFSRHKRVICLMNSVDDGVLLGFRKKAHIMIYKQLTKGFVDNVRNDRFVKVHAYDLTKLAVNEAIVYSTYKYFNNRIGKLKLDLKNYCPWYNDKISRNMANETFSAQFNRFSEKDKLATHYAKIAVDFFGEDLKKPRMQAVMLGWFKHEYPDQYFDLQRVIKDIYQAAMYMQYMRERGEDSHEDKKEGSHKEADGSVKPPEEKPAAPAPATSMPAAAVPAPELATPSPAPPAAPPVVGSQGPAGDPGPSIKAEVLAIKFDPQTNARLDKYQNQTHAKIWKRYHEVGKLDVVAAEFPSPSDPSKCFSVPGIRLVLVGPLAGWLSNQIGNDFEVDIEKLLKLKFPLGRVIHGGPKRPDFIVALPGTMFQPGDEKPPLAIFGRIFVYSIKCYDSIRPQTKLPIKELDPEIHYCQRCQALAAQKGNKIDITLVSIFYNIASKRVNEQIGVNFLMPPPTITIDEVDEAERK